MMSVPDSVRGLLRGGWLLLALVALLSVPNASAHAEETDPNARVAVSRIEPFLRAVQERYIAARGEPMKLPANAAGDPADQYPPDGFYNGVLVTEMEAIVSSAVNTCQALVSYYHEEPNPTSEFVSCDIPAGTLRSHALEIAMDALAKCRYLHFGPGGLVNPSISGTFRRQDRGRVVNELPFPLEWYNSYLVKFTASGGSPYVTTDAITHDDVYALSFSACRRWWWGYWGYMPNYAEYGFSLSYDFSRFQGIEGSATPFYSITSYSDLGREANGLPILVPTAAPIPFWYGSDVATHEEPPLLPWVTDNRRQAGPIITSDVFPRPSMPLKGTVELSLNMGNTMTTVQSGPNTVVPNYFYQINYRGLVLDLQFTRVVPPPMALDVAGVYPGSCPSCVGVIVTDYSLIDNGSMTYYHDAWDYQTDGAGGGCVTCGGMAGTAGGSPTDFALGRIHRYRDLDWGASHGPGVLSNFDFRLQIFAQDCVARFFDPMQRTVCEFTKAPTATEFHDTQGVSRSLALLDGAGAAVADITAARTAVLTLLDGRVLTFQLFRTPGAPVAAPTFDGRVVRIAELSGQALTLTYPDPDPVAALAVPGMDPARLWCFSRVTDRRNIAATFTWASAAGQWVIATATVPGGGVIRYAYDTNRLVSLNRIDYPTGEVSTFAATWDATNQFVTLRISDAGADGTHRTKSVSLTASIENGLAGDASAQLPNLVRQVANGSGEVNYRNWSVRDGDLLNIYVLTAGGPEARGILHRLQYRNGTPISSLVARVYLPGQDVADLDWVSESSYATDAHMRPATMADPDGSVTLYERDGDGNITTTTRKHPDGSVVSTESTIWDAQRHPLTVTDALGRVTKNVYDAAGLLTSRTVAVGTPDEATWFYDYDASGRLEQSRDANGNATDYTYDPATGQVASISEPADVAGGPRPTRHFTYDDAGRPLTSSDQAGRTVSYAYDGRGRPTVTSYADGSTEETVYGTGANANLVTKRKDRLGYWEEFTYDAAGRQTASVRNAGQPDQVVRSWVYVPGKALVASETVNGSTTSYAYDERGRVAAVTQAATATVAHTTSSETWDEQGVSVNIDHLGRATWSLQSVDRLRSRTVRELITGAVVEHLTGNRTACTATLWALTAPSDGSSVTYTIDEAVADAAGQMLASTDALGTVAASEYDAQGRTTASTTTDPAGRVIRSEYAYDDNGNRVRVVHPSSFASDGTPAGTQAITETAYTGRNLVSRQTDAWIDGDGHPVTATTHFTYTSTGKPATVSDPRNPAWLTRSFYGECCDRLKEVIDPEGFKTAFGYDAEGHQTSTTDANNNTTQTTYDAQGRVATRMDARGVTTAMSYDQDLTDGAGLDADFPTLVAGLGFGPGAVGAADLTTLPTGERTLAIRDGLGRTVRQAQLGKTGSGATPQVVTTRYGEADASGLESVTVRDAVGAETTTWTDAAGRVVKLKMPTGGEVAATYDAAGNPLSQVDANGVETTSTYDGLGRVVHQQVGSSGGVGRAYDAQGNVVRETDAAGVATVRTYDGMNRLVQVAHPVLGATRMTYDVAGRLETITDAQGGVTRYAYSPRGQLLSETHPGPNGGTQVTTYDPAGRVATRTDRRGIVTTFEYDAADRLTAKRYSTGKADTFAYDDLGRLVRASSGRYGTTVVREYDAKTGELAKEIQWTPVGTASVAFTRDAEHRLTSYQLDDGTTVSQDYSALGQVEKVRLDGTEVARRAYDAGGRLSQTTHGNQLRDLFGYTDGNQLQRITVSPPAAVSPGPVFDLAYGYDQRRRKTVEDDQSVGGARQSFAYDDAGRLSQWLRTPGEGGPLGTSAQSPAPATDRQTWSLSPIGDWLATTVNGRAQTRTHDAVHATTTITEASVTTALTYDASGNLTQDERGNRYTWDEENRLASVTVRDAGEGVTAVARMTYDALGRRLARSAFGTTTQFVLNDGQVLQERDIRVQPTGAAVIADDGELPAAGSPAPAGSILIAEGSRFVRHQPADRLIPDGWIADKGRSLAERTNGLTYGWIDAAQAPTELTAAQAVVRDVMPLPQFDAFHRFDDGAGHQASWRYALANGTYAVVVVAGDAASRAHTNHLLLNGQTLADPDPYNAADNPGYVRGDFDGWAQTVTVSDGFLTLGVGAGTLDPTVCFVEIGPLGSTVDQALRDKLAQRIQDATNRTGGDPFRRPPTPRTFVYGGDYIDAPVAVRTGSGSARQTYGIHSNSLYSVQAITDATGQVVERYTYGAYGDRRLEGETTGNSRLGLTIGFTGLRDEDGLIFARNRYFSPTLGRWIARDPAGYVDGYSLYGGYFVPGGIDPSGLMLFAFDGTGNYSDSVRTVDGGGGTNVAKMANHYNDQVFYYGGIGNTYENPNSVISNLQGFSGLGGAAIERRALSQLRAKIMDPENTDKNIDVIGFSRGSTMALDFLHMVKATIADKKMCAQDYKLRFVGLFDAVGSYGLPGNEINWGKDLYLPDGILSRSYYVAHAVAMDEFRNMFPSLDVVGANVQRAFRGNHSDIGGGYHNTGLSDITLSWMINQGMSAGAPFRPASGLRPNPTMLPHRELNWKYAGVPRKLPSPLYNPFGLKPAEFGPSPSIVGAKGGDMRRFAPGFRVTFPFFTVDTIFDTPYGYLWEE